MARLGMGWFALSWVWAWMIGVAIAQEPVSFNDSLWFTNGDHLRGHLVSIDPAHGIAWRNPDIKEQVPFNMDQVARVRLADRSPATLKPTNYCRVYFDNQDEIEGNLVSLDTNHLVLDTWYAGTLTLPRERLSSIQPIVSNPSIIYEGPTGMEGWTIGNSAIEGVSSNAWRYSQGAFLASQSASIARDLKLPAMANIEFDIAWNSYLSIAIALYADSLQPILLRSKETAPDFGAFYSLQLSYNSANLMLVKKGIPLNYMGVTLIPGMEQKTKAHISIRANKADRSIYLFIDGVLIKQWQDAEAFGGQGTCVRFVNQMPAPFKLANIVVSQWDGRMETPANKLTNAASDFVRLMNQDTVSGPIQTFRNGNIVVGAPFGPLEIPFQRIGQAHFSRTNHPPVEMPAGLIRAYFARRGMVSFAIDRWEQDQLVVRSPMFGPAKFLPSAFRLLVLRGPAPDGSAAP